MTAVTWIGIAGTIVALGFLLNAIRVLRASKVGHVANATRIHIPVVLVFLPVLWITVVGMQL